MNAHETQYTMCNQLYKCIDVIKNIHVKKMHKKSHRIIYDYLVTKYKTKK